MSEKNPSGNSSNPPSGSSSQPCRSRTKQEFTLGKVQKRVFSPTIPTSRRIKKEVSESHAKPLKKETKQITKVKKREKKDVIKSESVFSMGPAGRPSQGRERIGLATSASAGGSLINSMKKRPSKGTTPPPDEQDAVLEEEIMTKIKSEKERISLTAADLLSIDYTMGGKYLFMQLPDTLPINMETDGQSVEASLCSVPEGHIGKLRIHQSGKVSLVLGAVSLDVSIGTPCGFLQELVCIKPSFPDPKITSVGHITHRLVCTPNFDNIL